MTGVFPDRSAYLPQDLRSRFRNAVLAGREVAERGVRAALASMDVDGAPQSELGAALQRRLASYGRDLDGLVEECAYTQWHRVLFARFLAENELLLHDEGVSLTLADCADLAAEEDDGRDAWDVAVHYAGRMLPSIFRPHDPAARMRLAAEHREAMHSVVMELPTPVFTAADSLGWSYQYWQARRKDELNDSEVLIGGAELPAVTQLFTEPYMVDFLIDNVLGAWWDARHPDTPLAFGELRRDGEGRPAAGTLPSWPDAVAELRVIDPCCGSGHFLVAGFHALLRMRVAAEGSSPADAGDAVLRENLAGLELDARCIQIAELNLSVAAWLTGGYRPLPEMRLASSGMHIRGQLDDWRHLAGADSAVQGTLERVYGLMAHSDHLGSLINPRREPGGEAFVAELERALPAVRDAVAGLDLTLISDAYGDQILNAALALELLTEQHHLVVTNVPYLGAGKMASDLTRFVERRYPSGRQDLATAMLARCAELCAAGGTVAAVSPRHWLNLRTLSDFRDEFLDTAFPAVVGVLGSRAFTSIGGEVVNVTVGVFNRGRRPDHVAVLDAT
ncbi:MAG TPA: DNA methyltransferase, partial [Naasia sp.]